MLGQVIGLSSPHALPPSRMRDFSDQTPAQHPRIPA